MIKRLEQPSWVFVSHSSDDIQQVRRVRNYLENKGGSPLLFHLVALTDPDEFWPLIRREIEARNFFLYCESASAEEREWVRRERAAVAEISKRRAVRIGSINVEADDFNFGQLDDFLAKTRVFPSYARPDRDKVMPFLAALSRAGFQVFDDQQIQPATDWRVQIKEAVEDAARNGWIIVFLSQASLTSRWVAAEVAHARTYGDRLLAVVLEPLALPSQLATTQVFDATRDPAAAPEELARLLLTRTL